MTSLTIMQQMRRRMIEEIREHRQQIAMHQVEIAQLETSILQIDHLTEKDAGRANGAMAGVLPAGVEIAVRKLGHGGEDGSASKAAKLGLNRSGNRRGMDQKSHKPRKLRKGSATHDMRQRITAVLKHSDEPMTGNELGNYLGLPPDAVARKPMQNALYSMRVIGTLHRDPDKRYSLPKLSPAAH